ncbi:MAG: NAD(P)H-hydrate dehydratase [Clostridia bacterium]|nr:NAD(P)H-hydrate dehydratase [Clostridia bacterium]
MRSLLTPAQMYALEKEHFANGMPTLVAMENAASAFVDELIHFCGSITGKRIYVACGSGNNGGDGYAIARLAYEKGASVVLIPMTPADQLRGDALINAKRAIGGLSLPCINSNSLNDIQQPDVWVDALFGIGLNRPMPGSHRTLVDAMNKHRSNGSLVASVDVPSGLNAESGKIEGFSVQADLTVTFQYAKTGHFLLDGLDCTGKLVVRDIGLNRFSPGHSCYFIEPLDPACSAVTNHPFPLRRHNGHKGTYGHLLVVAGSFGMTGAAMYAAHAALRSGAGLVTIACPRSIVPVLQSLLPAAMCISLPEQDGTISEEAIPALTDALPSKSAVVIGPGLSTKASPRIIETILTSNLPAVIDADALNLIAHNPELISLLRPQHVLTPHPGEARRLCPDCTGQPLHDAELLSALNAVILLKGAASVIRGRKTYISASGSPGMATGGSGDVLSGIIGALLAMGFDPECAAWAGSEIHGRCGELAEQSMNPVSMLAADLIAHLPAAISELY